MLEAIRVMPKDKTSGVNDFPIEFYTINRDVLQQDIIATVKPFLVHKVCILLLIL